jgi:hypothetical protein
MEWPAPALDAAIAPTDRAIVHFEIDEIIDRLVGLGDNVFMTNYDDTTGVVKPQGAMMHLINFDVGIWSFSANGGLTTRMRLHQYLNEALGSAAGRVELNTVTDGGDGGIEILNYRGGRFVADKINDLNVHRMVDGQLSVRVFSRTPLADAIPGPAIEEIQQDPHLTIIG